MYKGFYTVDKTILLKDLKTVLDLDELHLIKIMFKTELIVRSEIEESDFFKTDTGVSKGDGSSATELTLYLARALYKKNNDHICKKSTIATSSELSSLSKHDYRNDRDQHFAIYQKYAGHISAITSDKNWPYQKGSLLRIRNSKPSCELNKIGRI